MQAIILAGGFGTRLQTIVKDVPKPMASISGKPFLYWLISYLQKNGVTKFVFSLGYLHYVVEDYLAANFSDTINYKCVIEDTPLGTGGAIKLCIKEIEDEKVLIVNGDSFFNLDIQAFAKNHILTNADCSIALKPMTNFDRYGSVELDNENRVLSFKEKQFCISGLINTGLLLFNKEIFLLKTAHLPPNFSYEKDFLEPNISSLNVRGYIAADYFIDIGIPDDYHKADKEIKNIIII